MTNYNYSKLLGLMKEHSITQEELAKKIGIGACTLNFSLNNKRDFRQAEILKICEVLDISTGQIEKYFFAH